MPLLCLISHKWNGCRCTRLGCVATRDEGHCWDGCICTRPGCRKTRDQEHHWDGCRCARPGCGRTRWVSFEDHDLREEKCSHYGCDGTQRRCVKCGSTFAGHLHYEESPDNEELH